jgi:hypothetical protein
MRIEVGWAVAGKLSFHIASRLIPPLFGCARWSALTPRTTPSAPAQPRGTSPSELSTGRFRTQTLGTL